MRRVVTGHDTDGRSTVVSDGDAVAVPYDPEGGFFHLLWGRDEVPRFPDDGEVTLEPGDVVILNGTMHRWHNRGSTTAKMISITVGAVLDAFPDSLR